tara:strand:- start:941 stop:2401 length:1461 start_codon:yes stop_codon:yes gene_type:complete
MGADKVLVDSFKELYASQGANYAEALSAPIISVAAEIAERQEKIRNKIDEHISLFPPEADVTDVPTNFVSDVLRPRLMNLRNEYAQYSEGFVRARSSEDKSKFKSLMDQTMNKVNALNSDIQNYKSLKSEGLFDYDNNLISKQAYEGRQGDKTDEIFNVFTGETELTIDEKTNKIGFFSNQENRFIPINEFSKFLPPQKAEKQATLFNSLLDSAGRGEITAEFDSEGNVLNSGEIDIAVKTLMASIEGNNKIQILKSFALDSLQIPGMSLLDTEADETKIMISELDSEDENIRKKAEAGLEKNMMNSFKGMLEDRIKIYKARQTASTQKQIEDAIAKQISVDAAARTALEKRFPPIFSDENYAKNLLINNNPNYEIDVPSGVTKTGFIKERVDITTQEGFNKNKALIRQAINDYQQVTDSKTPLAVDLVDGKILVGRLVTEQEQKDGDVIDKFVIGKEGQLGPFTTMEQIAELLQKAINRTKSGLK